MLLKGLQGQKHLTKIPNFEKEEKAFQDIPYFHVTTKTFKPRDDNISFFALGKWFHSIVYLLKKNNIVLLAYVPDFGTIAVFAENYSIKFSAEQITGVQKRSYNFEIP